MAGGGDTQLNQIMGREPHWFHTVVTVFAILALIWTSARNGELATKLDASKASNNEMIEWCELAYAHWVKTDPDAAHCPKPK